MIQVQYRNRSITDLVNQLHHLGQDNVLVQPIKLTAIHQQDSQHIKRFKNTHGDQFFTLHNNEKKYPYNEISQHFNLHQLQNLKELFQRGFNTSIVFSAPKEQGKLTQMLGQVRSWIGDCVLSVVEFSEEGMFEGVSGLKITERDLQNRIKYYKMKSDNLIIFLDKIIRSQAKKTVSLIKLRPSQPSITYNELNLISLPEHFHSPQLNTQQFIATAKSQLTQIFNYFKLNQNNKYNHFSKLLTKRLPITNVLANILLQSSASLVINWINEGSIDSAQERFNFYEKMRGISVFLKKEEGYLPIVIEMPHQSAHHEKTEKHSTKNKEYKNAKTERTPISHIKVENELDFCRSLERKTHKFSIDQQQLFENNNQNSLQDPSSYQLSYNPSPSLLQQSNSQHHSSKSRSPSNFQVQQFDETMPKKSAPQPYLTDNQEIAILKAQHAIEVSQYHQTIQQLNHKILVLTQQKGLEDLYTIHQKELMLLEMKIKELRNDIITMSNGEEKSYKGIIRKLNQEVKKLQGKNSQQKVASGRVAILQKQLVEVRKKYEQSEVSRKKLAFELSHLTKRLKICDSQIQTLNNKETKLQAHNPHSSNEEVNLSINDIEYLKQVQILLQGVREGSEQARQFLIRKITNILVDLSVSRQIILECNDFLMQLEQHLQEKLGKKQPQIVLDCNRFIRNFLMDNLRIF